MDKRRIRNAVAALAITVAVLALMWSAGRLHATAVALTKLEYTVCDTLLFGARGPLPTPEDVVVVAIDPLSVQNLGQWPFPRSYHAELVNRLAEMGAKVVAFDIVMDVGRGDQDDRELVDACRNAGNVIMAAQVDASEDSIGGHRRTTLVMPFEELREVCALGTVNFTKEEDSKVRFASAGHEVAGVQIPLLSVHAAASFLGVDAERLVTGNTLHVGETRIPLDSSGRFLINYVGKQKDVRTFSYCQFLPPPGESIGVPAEHIRDKVVFVGVTDPLEQDVVDIPYENTFPGVTVHANIASMLIRNQPIRRLPAGFGLLFAAVFAAGLSAASVSRRPQWAAISLVALITAYSMVAASLFSSAGIWIPVVVPLLGAALATIGGIIYGYLVEGRERRRISSLFSKYVSRDVARELMEDEGAAQLGTSRKLPVTCLFSDIRGFTSISERLSPEEVVAMLNQYFDRMVECVFENRGTLDKYVGDAIMATFGVPKSFGNDAERACRTAVRMREELTALQEMWAAEGRTGIDIGIGINTGDAVVGNIGHHERMEFTCIGDTINTASRLESLNKELGTKVLISQSTYDAIRDLGLFEVRRLPPAHVKGKAEAIQVYELLGWAKPGAERSETEEPATIG